MKQSNPILECKCRVQNNEHVINISSAFCTRISVTQMRINFNKNIPRRKKIMHSRFTRRPAIFLDVNKYTNVTHKYMHVHETMYLCTHIRRK